MKINIAIDGPSASGKSTIAKRLAKILDYVHIDTGSMYRATAYKALKNGIHLDDEASVVEMLDHTEFDFTAQGQLIMDGNLVGHEVRNTECDRGSSQVSRLQNVRAKLVSIQQKITLKKGFILDGRDIGTVVLPDAELKIFQVAFLLERAKRRHQEFHEKGNPLSFDEVYEDLRSRDIADSTRTYSPLKKADDAIELDTSFLSIDETVEKITQLYQETVERLNQHD
ncbi:MAG: (d)CMP kinase [Erysipelotrichaceae bacterium]|nr:(d)CMP kinase [Erysipelotrichaceae bacterium]